MARYRFTHPDKRTTEVSAHSVAAAWVKASEALDVRRGDDAMKLRFETLVDPKLPTDLEALARLCTSNGAFTLRFSVEKSVRADGASDLGGMGLDVFTGLGKYTTLAAMGVFAGLRKLGLGQEVVTDDCSWNHDRWQVPGATTRITPNERWAMTPLGRSVGEMLVARCDRGEMMLCKDSA